MNNRPPCANPKCNNKGWVNMGGEWYCGECVTKFNKKQREMIKKEMEDL